MITSLINFENVSLLHQWYTSFENKCLEICKTYNAMEVWDKAVILRDEKSLELAIVSIGAWDVNSNQYTVANKILEIFEETVECLL